MKNSNIIKSKNNYLGYLPKKPSICAMVILSTTLFFNNVAFSKEQEKTTEGKKTIPEQQNFSNSVDPYFQDYKKQIYQMFQEMDKTHNKLFLRDWGNLGELFTTNDRMRTNLATYDQQYVLNIDYPGFDKKELEVEISGDYLTINGKKETEGKTDKEKLSFNQEYRSSFQHRLLIPKDVDTNSISSSLKNGVLTIVLPRVEEKKQESKKIPIN